MLTAGIWKITDPIAAATRMNQALVPAALSIPTALAFGISEMFSGVMLLVSRFRRWGAWLSGLLLIAFLLYIGINYGRLAGDDCNCFPWIDRAVGPAFFVGDVVMLLMAVAVSFWSSRPYGIKSAALVLAAVGVFAGVSLGMALTRPLGVQAPDSILVDGKPFSLGNGRVFLYFFDPECTSCLFSAQDMSEFKWLDVQVIMVPTERKQLASQFVEATGWDAPLSSDSEKLREVFRFGDPPHGVILENGRQVGVLNVFDGGQPKAIMEALGFIE